MNNYNPFNTPITQDQNFDNPITEMERRSFFTIGALFFIFFLPIATYRTITESWELALLDWMIMLVNAILLSYGWISNQIRIASFFYILLLSCAAIVGTVLINPNLVLYAFAITLMGFYLLPLNLALLACGAPICGLILFIMVTNTPIVAPILILLFANLGIAVMSCFARRQLERIAGMIDPKTLEQAINRKGRGDIETDNFRDPEKHASSMLIFSFSNLDAINEKYGHPTADSILTHAVTLLAEEVRLQDRIYVSGRDAFQLVIDGASTKDANLLAEKLRRTLLSSSVLHDYKVSTRITVAELLNKDAITGWIKRGDKVLFDTEPHRENTDSLIIATGPSLA